MSEVELLPNREELEEARGKAFTRRVALTTALFAVILAIASLGGNNAMRIRHIRRSGRCAWRAERMAVR
jgi:hypothetical protein